MNLKKLLPLLPLIVLLLVGCQQEPVNLDVEKSDLMRTDNEFAHLSAEKGASVAFRAYVSEDAILMPDRGHPIQGRDAIYEWMKGG
ncbi:hypothetical protein KKA00_01445, partial [bacterium]|nr:hypothetical protein [bacterium]